MTVTARKVAFVCLPDEHLEIFSTLSLTTEYQPEVVIDSSTDGYTYALAEIIDIPTSTELSALRQYPCDIVVVPDERPDLKVEVAEILGDEPVVVHTVSEMAAILGIQVTQPADHSYSLRDWVVPFGLKVDALARLKAAAAGADPVASSVQAPPFLIETMEGIGDEAPLLQSPAPETQESCVVPMESSRSLEAMAETLKLAFDKHLLLRRILQIAINTAGGDAGSIMLIDESSEYLRIAVAEGLSDEVVRNTRQRIGDGVAGNVLLEGRSRILTRTLDDPRYRGGRERSALKGAVCVPLLMGSQAVGVLNVTSDTRPDAFDEGTITLLERFGVQMAGIVLKALELASSGGPPLHSTLKNQIEGLMSLEGPLRRRLAAVAEAFAGYMDAAACRIYLLDGTGKRLELTGEHVTGPNLAGPRSILADTGIIGWVLQRGRPEAFEPSYAEGEKRALFYFPLPGSQGPIGVVEAESVAVTPTGSAEAFETMVTAAGHLAWLVERERSRALLERRADQILRLSDLAVELVENREPEEIPALAARSAAEVFGADVAAVRTVPEGGVTLSVPDFATRGGGFASALLAFEEDLSAYVIESRRIVTSATMPTALQERLAALESFDWAAAIPLSGASEGTVGVVTLYGANGGLHGPQADEHVLMERLGRCLGRALSRTTEAGGAARAAGSFLPWSAFLERVAEESLRSKRFGRPFAVTAVEIEGLRRHGQARGLQWADRARVAFARFVRSQVREVDLTAWANDERIALLRLEASPDASALHRRLSELWGRTVQGLGVDGLADLPLRMDDLHFAAGGRDWNRCAAEVEERFGRGSEGLRKAA